MCFLVLQLQNFFIKKCTSKKETVRHCTYLVLHMLDVYIHSFFILHCIYICALMGLHIYMGLPPLESLRLIPPTFVPFLTWYQSSLLGSDLGCSWVLSLPWQPRQAPSLTASSSGNVISFVSGSIDLRRLHRQQPPAASSSATSGGFGIGEFRRLRQRRHRPPASSAAASTSGGFVVGDLKFGRRRRLRRARAAASSFSAEPYFGSDNGSQTRTDPLSDNGSDPLFLSCQRIQPVRLSAQ